jgi:hypothetical protein
LQKQLCIPACLFVLMFLILPAKAQTIWFGPHSTVPDYMGLFKPDAPWQNAASHVSVIGIPDEFLTKAPDSDLQQIFVGLKRRNIKLMVQMFPLAGRPTPEAPECGVAVEGYGAPGGSLLIARKVKRLGGEIDYFGMDEPLYYGRDFDRYDDQNRNPQRRGCHLTISEVAGDAAARLKQVRSVFPNVKVGDVEPFMAFPDSQWETELSNWFDAFHSATGEPLAFFRLDLIWIKPWQSRMPKLAALLRSKGIPLQVIYDGSSNAGSDAAWVSQAKQRFQQFEGTLGFKPDGAVLQSWAAWPSHALPDSDPNTMTGLVLQYVNWKHARQEDVIHAP